MSQEFLSKHFNLIDHKRPASKSSALLLQLWLCVLVVLVLSGLRFEYWRRQTISSAQQHVQRIKTHIDSAKESLSTSNPTEAISNLGLARSEVRKLKLETVQATSKWTPGISKLTEIADSGEKIIEELQNIAENLLIKTDTNTPRGLVAGESIRPTITSLHAVALESESALSQADSIVNILPGMKKYSKYTTSLKQVTEQGLKIASFVKDLSERQLTTLIMLQNNNELRPSGGFFGTFALMDIQEGAPRNIHVSSIYDLDGQLEKQPAMQPPLPLLVVNERWLLRDSNWNADFAVNAERVREMLHLAGKPKPDLVIAITPAVVTRILDVTGPIEMPDYGLTLTAENFVELTQVQTSLAYDKIENKPKELLADMMPIVITRLLDANSGKLQEKLQRINESFASKDIQLYADNHELQSQIEALGWSGKVKPAVRDSLVTVRSNLSGTKTDLHIEQSSVLESQINRDGSVTNTLTITLSNTLPKSTSSETLSFLRILTPLGSKLISAQGFDQQDLETARALNTNPLHKGAIEWENGLVKDLASGSFIGQESGKTFFGNWLNLEGGQAKTVVFTYKLPFVLNETDRLSLSRQVQPGIREEGFIYKLKVNGFKVRRTSLNSDKDGVYEWHLPTDKDSLTGVVVTAN